MRDTRVIPFEVPETDILKWRRQIHANPELSFKEHNTSDLVEKVLTELGLKPIRPTPTSIVADLRGSGPGKTVALRAEMDALPLQEETGRDFASKNPGVMHACGHDGHTAMLLGTATILSKMTDKFKGTVRFVFQHAEELLPGGAREMVKAGAVEGVDAIFGLHIMNQKAGTITVCPGPATTAGDVFYLTVKGRGSHGSMPQAGIDPILVGSEIELGLHTIASRSTNPRHMVVVSPGMFQGGAAPNVMPDTARIGVSYRTVEPEDRDLVRRRCEEIVKGICEANGAGYEFDWLIGYAVVNNDPGLAQVALKAARTALGEQTAAEGPGSSVSEDFSAFSNTVPGCFIFLGGGTAADGLPYQNHHPKFDIAESCLACGTRTEVQIVLDMLGK
jgi:amidohydrolase